MCRGATRACASCICGSLAQMHSCMHAQGEGEECKESSSHFLLICVRACALRSGECPHDIFLNTKFDLWPCEKKHDDQAKAQSVCARDTHTRKLEELDRFA